MSKRSLYQCFNAKVLGDIYCSEGHRLSEMTKDGRVLLRRLERGAPLVMSACQGCFDYSEMGIPLVSQDRGWR